MEIQGSSTSGTSGSALEVKSLQLAKQQQEKDGEAQIQLIESADVPKAASEDGKGSMIDTFA